MKKYIQLIRTKEYIKNLILFLPIFFGHKIINVDLLVTVFIAFVAFSLCASGVYIINDYLDIQKDRLHTIKKNRPLAMGTISKSRAFVIMSLCFLIGGTLIIFLSLYGALLLGVYVLMNIAYSLKLKHIPILDVTIIATGFVLRLFVGSVVIMVPLSMWIVIMIFLLALFMGFGKRRDDIVIFHDTGQKMRTVVDGYNLPFLDGAMMIMASIVIVSYIMYTTSTEIILKLNANYLYITSLFVILGILRYLQITLVEKDSGSPTQIVLRDKFLFFTIVGWLCSYIWIIYL
jgi:decaprenyl-phosphate phosphoribosyltransferase